MLLVEVSAVAVVADWLAAAAAAGAVEVLLLPPESERTYGYTVANGNTVIIP